MSRNTALFPPILAVLLALLFPCGRATAEVIRMVLDEQLSSITLDGTFGNSSWGPQSSIFGRSGGVSHYAGFLDVDLEPGTIQLLPAGSQVIAKGNVPFGFDHYTDDYFLPGNPATPSSPAPGNYALQAAFGFFQLRIAGLQVAPSSDYVTNTPALLAGPAEAQVFSVSQQVWEGTAGTQFFRDTFSGLGYSTADLANWAGPGLGIPMPLGGALNIIPGNESFTPNATTGNWNAVTQTLTLNVAGSVTFRTVVTNSNIIINTFTVDGQLVMHPVPEPSTLVLGCAGLVGFTLILRHRGRRSSQFLRS